MKKAESTIANYMSKHPKVQIALNIIFGLFVLWGSWWGRQELIAWELTGGEKTLPRFVYWLYSIGGVNAPAILFGLGGLIFFFQAYRIFKNLHQK